MAKKVLTEINTNDSKLENLFDRQNKELAQVVSEQNASMFEALSTQAMILRGVQSSMQGVSDDMKAINDNYELFDKRLQTIERLHTWKAIIIRGFAVISAAAAAALLLHHYWIIF